MTDVLLAVVLCVFFIIGVCMIVTDDDGPKKSVSLDETSIDIKPAEVFLPIVALRKFRVSFVSGRAPVIVAAREVYWDSKNDVWVDFQNDDKQTVAAFKSADIESVVEVKPGRIDSFAAEFKDASGRLKGGGLDGSRKSDTGNRERVQVRPRCPRR